MQSHIVVVNHHLFFADLRLRRDLGAFDADLVIPGYKRVVFDEAHRMEEVEPLKRADADTYKECTQALARYYRNPYLQ